MKPDPLADMALTAAKLQRARAGADFPPTRPRDAAIAWTRRTLKRVHADTTLAAQYVEISERYNVPDEQLIVFIRWRRNPTLDGWALWCFYHSQTMSEKEERLNAPPEKD
jgi:hypothetical protein